MVALPRDERVFNPSRETRRILGQAKGIGPDAERLCKKLFAVHGDQYRLWGIVGLANRYPRRLVDCARAHAMVDGVHSCRDVNPLNEQFVADAVAAIDTVESPRQGERVLTTQDHPLILPADIYAELLARCAGQPSHLPEPASMTFKRLNALCAIFACRESPPPLHARYPAQSSHQPFLEASPSCCRTNSTGAQSRQTERRFTHFRLEEGG